jgi:hypothetical protein
LPQRHVQAQHQPGEVNQLLKYCSICSTNHEFLSQESLGACAATLKALPRGGTPR